MTNFGNLLSLVMGTDDHSSAYRDVLCHGDSLNVKVEPQQITLDNDNGTVTLRSENKGNDIVIVCTNLFESEIIIRDARSALSFALYRLDVRLDPEDEEVAKTSATGYATLPKPKATFADHSYPAYTKEQMLEYARENVVRFTGMNPAIIDAIEHAYEDMYKEEETEWCDQCGGQIGDDCDCNEEDCDCDGEDCDCDCEGECDCHACPHCNSASCQCLPDCEQCGRASCDCDIEEC